MLRGDAEGSAAEDRLTALVGQKSRDKSKTDRPALLSSPLDETLSIADHLLAKIGNISQLMEQADVQHVRVQVPDDLRGVCGRRRKCVCLHSSTCVLTARVRSSHGCAATFLAVT